MAADTADTADFYDVVIVGGGAAGLAAARAARWEGASTALISDAPLGGDCTFTGCVPSKSLIEASRQGLDFAQATEHVRSVVDRIAATESAEVLRADGVEVIEGRATFAGSHELLVQDRVVRGDTVIIATGSRPALPPITGLEATPYRTNESFFEPRPMPQSLVIVGAGPVGCELGEAMARFGTKVTLVEFAPRILNRYEPDASRLVHENMTTLGIDVRVNTAVQAVDFVSGDTADLPLTVTGSAGRFVVDLGEQSVTADELLIASGRTPNTNGLALEATNVRLTDRGYIDVNSLLQTSVDGVYAVGDCNGLQMLSHAADEMGRTAVWTALRPGRRYPYDPNRIPHAVFTTPEIAAIGIVEADAPRNARVAELPMSVNDRALAADASEGFVRMIARPARFTRHKAGGKVIGATIVGGRAAEMINEVALTMRGSGYPVRLAQTVRAYPSWSTIMQKTAALWFFEYEGHQARPPRRR